MPRAKRGEFGNLLFGVHSAIIAREPGFASDLHKYNKKYILRKRLTQAQF
jgi:hypothetical protein